MCCPVNGAHTHPGSRDARDQLKENIVMATTSVPASHARARTPVALHVASAALVLLASITTVGAFIFHVPGSLPANSLLVALVTGSAGMIVSALRLHRGERLAWNLARSLAGAHLLWSIYKVFVYGETESFPFLIAGTFILTLLHLPASRRFIEASGR